MDVYIDVLCEENPEVKAYLKDTGIWDQWRSQTMGSRARLKGLKAEHLNGREGSVGPGDQCWDLKAGRWQVLLDGSEGKVVSVKPVNVEFSS